VRAGGQNSGPALGVAQQHYFVLIFSFFFIKEKGS
jgi:hypothetical protein